MTSMGILRWRRRGESRPRGAGERYFNKTEQERLDEFWDCDESIRGLWKAYEKPMSKDDLAAHMKERVRLSGCAIASVPVQ